ncbi:uncharacterized protein B0J16DRAFT_258114 [Fusarium flagelliforme]|uniref:Peptidoglycan-binding lysm n=1 Tax=Fusarium flagelliforme TaxID=2675880 RepID=A0A395MLA8_9HYPO|nr:uncharacterized protein B0J16DRAFT_258114 [Fusarium flagelliforme]KAH7198818.1 hypothetical protein B0J16DRAFT_258114 [Fusarium flagelliforme]RFN48590.1 peptidoglycan-binding lysm [Fusarium flagelliforme]
MSRFSRYDTDEERLPEGMQRVGYDADTQVYTFRDADGSFWESAPGNQYGQLTKVGEARPEGQESESFLVTNPQYHQPKMSWFTEMKPFLNFLMLIILSMLLLFWFLGHKSSPEEHIPIPDCPEGTVAYGVKQGDTCWSIAKKAGVDLDEILKKNKDVDCEALMIGDRICVPGKKSID